MSQVSLGASVRTRKRIALICRELVNESWLPIGLRSQVAEDVMQLSKEASALDCDVRYLEELVTGLEAVVLGYGELTMESKVVQLICSWREDVVEIANSPLIRVLNDERAMSRQWKFAS